MIRRYKRSKGDGVKLEMTPMIDVVFQLLIFFVVSVRQEDILSSIMAMRPDGSDRIVEPRPDYPTTIIVDYRGFKLRDRAMTETELASTIERAAKYDVNKPVVIKCTPDSSHQDLMKALDICARFKMKNIAIFTM